MIRYFNLSRPFQGLFSADPPLPRLSLDVCRPACTSNTNRLKGHFREAGLCTLSRVNRARHYVQTWGDRRSFTEDIMLCPEWGALIRKVKKNNPQIKSKMSLLLKWSSSLCHIRFLRPPIIIFFEWKGRSPLDENH